MRVKVLEQIRGIGDGFEGQDGAWRVFSLAVKGTDGALVIALDTSMMHRATRVRQDVG